LVLAVQVSTEPIRFDTAQVPRSRSHGEIGDPDAHDRRRTRRGVSVGPSVVASTEASSGEGMPRPSQSFWDVPPGTEYRLRRSIIAVRREPSGQK
jgi:hypothetical protein